jgi:hypothetical protein
LKSLVEQTTKTGQLFRESKFAGVARTATAFGGTTFPPWAANDFSCALKGTLARAVDPGENATPANFKEDSAAFAANVEPTVRVTMSEARPSKLFRTAHASRVLGMPVRLGEAPSPQQAFLTIIALQFITR